MGWCWARFAQEKLIGFSFAYLGRVHGQWALYSQLTGVDPTTQARGVGGKIKRYQRAWARAQGLPLVAWTYDPLQAGNANFNLHHLGATSRTYQINYFGERSDALNAGLDSDRLLVEWPTEDIPRAWAGEGYRTVVLISCRRLSDGLPAPEPRFEALPGPDAGWPPLAIAIPPSLAALRAQDLNLARAWQVAVRDAFLHAFAAGYVAVDFTREQNGLDDSAYYVLRHPA